MMKNIELSEVENTIPIYKPTMAFLDVTGQYGDMCMYMIAV